MANLRQWGKSASGIISDAVVGRDVAAQWGATERLGLSLICFSNKNKRGGGAQEDAAKL